ncbi:MAG: RIO1 family regulatory kinase/ATPase [Promethearchaeota archaeon]
MRKEKSQRLGYEFSKHGRRYDEYRQNRVDSKLRIKEVTVAEVRDQLLATGRIDKVLAVIGGGKEATVLLAQERETGDYICAKVFRYFTSTIRKRSQGTHHILPNEMARITAKQEYWNLLEMHQAKIPVPRPRYLIENVVVMEFIHTREEIQTPAPLLHEVNLNVCNDPEEVFYDALDILADLFLKANFVHGDYSEHNLMVTENGLITMDVSQSVQYNRKTFIDTPMRIRIDKAVAYLEADINNLNLYFQKRYRLSIDPLEIRQNIIEELPPKLYDFLMTRTLEIYPEELIAPEVYFAKENYRGEAFFERTGKQPYACIVQHCRRRYAQNPAIGAQEADPFYAGEYDRLETANRRFRDQDWKISFLIVVARERGDELISTTSKAIPLRSHWLLAMTT